MYANVIRLLSAEGTVTPVTSNARPAVMRHPVQASSSSSSMSKQPASVPQAKSKLAIASSSSHTVKSQPIHRASPPANNRPATKKRPRSPSLSESPPPSAKRRASPQVSDIRAEIWKMFGKDRSMYVQGDIFSDDEDMEAGASVLEKEERIRLVVLLPPPNPPLSLLLPFTAGAHLRDQQLPHRHEGRYRGSRRGEASRRRKAPPEEGKGTAGLTWPSQCILTMSGFLFPLYPSASISHILLCCSAVVLHHLHLGIDPSTCFLTLTANYTTSTLQSPVLVEALLVNEMGVLNSKRIVLFAMILQENW